MVAVTRMNVGGVFAVAAMEVSGGLAWNDEGSGRRW